MAFGEKDFLLVDFTIVTKEDGKVIDTTIEKVAKEAGIYSPEARYEPRLIVPALTRVVDLTRMYLAFTDDIKKAILSAEPNKEVIVEIPPEKGFGRRDPSKVRSYPLSRVVAENRRIPSIGEEVRVEGKVGRVIAITGGRVLIDFNHPLAGKTIVVKAVVVGKIDDAKERVKALVHEYEPRVSKDEVTVELSDGTLTIKLPEKVLGLGNFQGVKSVVLRYIRECMPDVKKVVFVEEVKLVEEREEKKSLEAGKESGGGSK